MSFGPGIGGILCNVLLQAFGLGVLDVIRDLGLLDAVRAWGF